MTRVRLLRPHIVNGTTYPPGKVLDLPADVVEDLTEAKVAEGLSAPQAKPAVAKPQRPKPTE